VVTFADINYENRPSILTNSNEDNSVVNMSMSMTQDNLKNELAGLDSFI